jgi:hypothetical protein
MNTETYGATSRSIGTESPSPRRIFRIPFDYGDVTIAMHTAPHFCLTLKIAPGYSANRWSGSKKRVSPCFSGR